METNQFAEFVASVVRSLPRDLDSGTAQRWIREQRALTDVLRKALMPAFAFELYLAPGQRDGGWMTGFDLEKHLEETKLIERAFSLEDELVKGWLANPATYPKELKTKAVFLWRSRRAIGSNREVACLYWSDDRVIVDWGWLVRRWYGDNLALLASF